MKKKNIALCTLLTAGVLALAGCSPIGKAEAFDTKKTLEGDVSTVEVSTTNADVTIVPSTDSKIGVHFYGSTNNPEDYHLTAKADGGKLSVIVDHDNRLLTGSQSLRLEVSVPQKTYDKWSIHTSSGDVTLDAPMTKELTVDTSSGQTKLSSVKGNRISLQTSSGDQRLTDVAAASVSVHTSSGDVEMQSVQGDALDLSSNSGSFTLNDIDAAVKTVTSSGKVKLTMKDIKKDIDMQSSSGDISVKLPSSASFVLDTSTSSGSVNVNFPVAFSDDRKKTKHGIVGQGGPLVRFATSSGDVTVEKSF